MAEHKLPEKQLAEISRMLDWFQSVGGLSSFSCSEFTADGQRLVVANQVLVDLADGTLSTPLIQGHGLPADCRAVYTAPLRPLPHGGFLAPVHDGQLISLRPIGRREEVSAENSVSGKPATPTTNQTGYAIDVALPPPLRRTGPAAVRIEQRGKLMPMPYDPDNE